MPVWATDPVDYCFAETQDAQALTYSDEAFDRVFSVSVVEHIVAGDGDVNPPRENAQSSDPLFPAEPCGIFAVAVAVAFPHYGIL